MGWLWGSRSPPGKDAQGELDSDLKDFLQKQTPIKYEPAAPKAPQIQKSKKEEDAAPTKAAEKNPDPSLPTESLFQDGRYADLWKNYKPLAEIEEATKSDQEKLMDVLQGYKERKRTIGKVALENCAEEQWDVRECYNNGSFADKMLLCRKQRKAMDRCYTLQSQFLKALGYLSTYDRPAPVDEEIQMHADTLYHRMIDQEKAIAEAKAAGGPVPEEEPINPATTTMAKIKDRFSSKDTAKSEDLPVLSKALQDVLRPEAQMEMRKKMQGLSPGEKELLEQQKMGEYHVAMEVQRLRSEVLEGRKQRRKDGTATIGDTISGWLGW